MKPKIFIDGEHGTTGLQIRSRLERRDDLELLSIPESERRNVEMREAFLRSADVAILACPTTRRARRFRADRTAPPRPSTRPPPIGPIPTGPTAFRSSTPASVSGSPRRPAWPIRAVTDRRHRLDRPLVAASILPADYPVTVNAVSAITRRQADDRADGRRHARRSHRGAALPLRPDAPAQARGGDEGARPARPAADLLAQRRALSRKACSSRCPCIRASSQAPLRSRTSMARLPSTIARRRSSRSCRLPRAAARTARSDGNWPARDRCASTSSGQTAGGQVNLVASLDNLGKGASGAAVQNMDLMLGCGSGIKSGPALPKRWNRTI